MGPSKMTRSTTPSTTFGQPPVLAVVEEPDVLRAEVSDDRVADRSPSRPRQRSVRSPTRTVDPAVLAGPVEASIVPSRPLFAPMNSATNRVSRLEVDVGLRPDLLDAARVHHDDPVGDRERLGLVVGDIDRRSCRSAAGGRGSSTSACLAGSGRAPTGARRTAGPAGPLRGPGPGRSAAAGRPRAGPAAARRSPRGRPSPASPRPGCDRVLLRALDRQPEATLSATDRCGNRAGDWNTKPMFRFRGGRNGHVVGRRSRSGRPSAR